ncbi:MAG: hypothetical protein ACLSHC_11630 [Bilophila wadsworthia]
MIFHLVQIRDLDDGGRGLIGVDGLAFVHGHGNDGPVERRGDAGVAEVDLVRVHGDPGLPDLRFEFGHFGLGEGIGVLGVLEAFLGGRVALLELHLTVILGFGDLQGHLLAASCDS